MARQKSTEQRIILGTFFCQLIANEDEDVENYVKNQKLSKRKFFLEVVRFYMKHHPLNNTTIELTETELEVNQIKNKQNEPIQVQEKKEIIPQDNSNEKKDNMGEKDGESKTSKSKYSVNLSDEIDPKEDNKPYKSLLKGMNKKS